VEDLRYHLTTLFLLLLLLIVGYGSGFTVTQTASTGNLAFTTAPALSTTGTLTYEIVGALSDLIPTEPAAKAGSRRSPM